MVSFRSPSASCLSLLFTRCLVWEGYCSSISGEKLIIRGVINSRLMMATVRNGFLWTCHAVGLSGNNGILSVKSVTRWPSLGRTLGVAPAIKKHQRLVQARSPRRFVMVRPRDLAHYKILALFQSLRREPYVHPPLLRLEGRINSPRSVVEVQTNSMRHGGVGGNFALNQRWLVPALFTILPIPPKPGGQAPGAPEHL